MDETPAAAEAVSEGEAPAEPASRRAWQVPLMAFAGLALLAGLAAAATSGMPRRVGLLVLLLCGLGLAWAASARSVPRGEAQAMGGAGYRPPARIAERALHTVLSLAYNLGVILVVFAALVRFGVLPLEVPARAAQAFPAVLGLYLVLLALAVRQRIVENGGVVRTWYTRLHGWFLAALALPGVLVAVVLLTSARVEVFGAGLTDPDLQVFTLIGVLGVGTQLFLVVHLPTTFDLVADLLRFAGGDKASRGTPPILYALVLTAVATAVIGFLAVRLSRTRVIDIEGSGGLFTLLLPVGLGLFLLVSAVQMWREGRRGLIGRRLSRKTRDDLVVFGSSTVAGLILSTLLALNLMGRIDAIGPFPGGYDLSKDLIVLTILSVAGPIGWHLTRQARRIDAIEGRLPDFLNDLAETRRAGLTLAASLQSCALADYGAMTPEIQKMANQVSWGIAFTDALQQFAGRVQTKLVQRSVHLIVEASKTGGSVSDILKAAAADAYEIKSIESERRVNMTAYLLVLYVVFFVFLVVIAVLDAQFIPQVVKASQLASQFGQEGPISSSGSGVDVEEYEFIFFLAAMVQAMGHGIVSGVLSEGRYSAGLRHVAIMALMGWMTFRFLL